MGALRGGAGPLALVGRRPARPPRIGHLLNTLEVSGLANEVTAACNGLLPGEFPSVCLCLDQPGDRTGPTRPQAELHSLELARRPAYRVAQALAQVLRRERIDLLHTHGWPVYPVGLAAAALARVPCLLHSDHWGSPGGDEVGALSLGRWLTTRFLTGTRYTAAALARRGVPAGKIELVRVGVDCARFRPGLGREATRSELGIGAGQVVLGSVGRLRQAKNYGMLIEAAAQLHAEGVDLRCVLVGDGLEEDTLRLQASQLGIGGRVQITGFTTEIPTMLAAMDVFVLPSNLEGVPHTLLEAMACGLPVVATSVGGTPELIRDGENGLLVPAARPRILALILKQLIESPARREALGARARRFVEEQHRVEQMLEDLAGVYRSALSRVSAPFGASRSTQSTLEVRPRASLEVGPEAHPSTLREFAQPWRGDPTSPL